MQIDDSRDRILSELEIRADPFAICTLEGICSMGLGRNPRATLHYVLAGRGHLTIQSRPSIELTPGRLILVPACLTHSLRHDGGGDTNLPACEPAGLNIQQHRVGGSGDGAMTLLCSTVSLGLRNTHGLIDLLQSPLSCDISESAVADRAIRSLLAEMARPRVGRRAMVRALLLQCVIEMLRNRIEADDPSALWLCGLTDPALWRALRAMLDNPGAIHSLESLSEAAGMSRSRFAERFQEVYGQAPMSFLRDLRLARAAQLLTEGREPIKRIAGKVGFSSRSAFSRAFTASWGRSPREFRADRG